MSASRPLAVVTGASSGIGAATAIRLGREGFDLLLGARRTDRLDEVAARVDAAARVRLLALDVTDPASVAAFAGVAGGARVLVNNAGLARGLTPIADAGDAAQNDWRAMLETNVLGLLAVTRALLPILRAGATEAAPAHIVNLGSIAGFEVYPGGAGYTASKHAVRAITRTLRLELAGEPVRLTEISPGMVETEFSFVRFAGDEARAADVYRGVTPLSADDVADAIAYAVTRPAHVDIDEIVIRPLRQAAAHLVARRDGA